MRSAVPRVECHDDAHHQINTWYSGEFVAALAAPGRPWTAHTCAKACEHCRSCKSNARCRFWNLQQTAPGGCHLLASRTDRHSGLALHGACHSSDDLTGRPLMEQPAAARELPERPPVKGGLSSLRQSASPLLIDVPPVSQDMSTLLAEAGLTLREALVESTLSKVAGSRADSRQQDEAVIAVVGLSRYCAYPGVAERLLRDCVSGRGSVFALLQHYTAAKLPADVDWLRPGRGRNESALPRTFGECAGALMRAARAPGSRCRFVLARQWFTSRDRFRCSGVPKIATFQRTVVQTIAVGRAYQWLRAAFGARARLIVRTRLEDAVCLPEALPSPRTRWLLIVNGYRRDSLSGAAAVGDHMASMTADVAEIYFNAWRVWLPHLNCSSPCFASGGWVGSDAANTNQAWMCTGELPLSRWLALHGVGAHRVMPEQRLFPNIAGQTDVSTVMASEDVLAGWRERACPACWPRCLPPPPPFEAVELRLTLNLHAPTWLAHCRSGPVWKDARCVLLNVESRLGCRLAPRRSPPGAGELHSQPVPICSALAPQVEQVRDYGS